MADPPGLGDIRDPSQIQSESTNAASVPPTHRDTLDTNEVLNLTAGNFHTDTTTAAALNNFHLPRSSDGAGPSNAPQRDAALGRTISAPSLRSNDASMNSNSNIESNHPASKQQLQHSIIRIRTQHRYLAPCQRKTLHPYATIRLRQTIRQTRNMILHPYHHLRQFLSRVRRS